MKNSLYSLRIMFITMMCSSSHCLHRALSKGSYSISNINKIQRRLVHGHAWPVLLTGNVQAQFKSWHGNTINLDTVNACYVIHRGKKNQKLRQDLIVCEKDPSKQATMGHLRKKALEDIHFSDEENANECRSTLALRTALVQRLCGKVYNPELPSATKELGSFYHESDDIEGTYFATTGISAFLCSRKPIIKSNEVRDDHDLHSQILVDPEVTLFDLIATMYTVQWKLQNSTLNLKSLAKLENKVKVLDNGERIILNKTDQINSTERRTLGEIYRLQMQQMHLLNELNQKPDCTVLWDSRARENAQFDISNFQLMSLLATIKNR